MITILSNWYISKMSFKIILKILFFIIFVEFSCSNKSQNDKKTETKTQKSEHDSQIQKNTTFTELTDSIKYRISKSDTFMGALRYGKHSNQTFDFYIPKRNNNLLVVMVHGGSWLWGNNKSLKDISIKLNNEGFNVININYRICSIKKTISLDSQLIDLKNATEYAKSYYFKLQKRKMDKIYLVGVSAGGNLVLLALQELLIKPDAVIAISPPTLLEDSVFLNNKIDKNLSFNYVVEQCFQKNELRKFTVQKSKLLETGVPILITHGKMDKIIPIQHSKYLVENSPKNSKIRLIEFPWEGHNYTTAKDSLLIQIIEFLPK